MRVPRPASGLSRRVTIRRTTTGGGRWRRGGYVIQYNESLSLGDEEQAVVTPLERTLQAGAHHGSFVLDDDRDPLETLLVVSRMGCRPKENCRVSRLVVLD